MIGGNDVIGPSHYVPCLISGAQSICMICRLCIAPGDWGENCLGSSRAQKTLLVI